MSPKNHYETVNLSVGAHSRAQSNGMCDMNSDTDRKPDHVHRNAAHSQTQQKTKKKKKMNNSWELFSASKTLWMARWSLAHVTHGICSLCSIVYSLGKLICARKQEVPHLCKHSRYFIFNISLFVQFIRSTVHACVRSHLLLFFYHSARFCSSCAVGRRLCVSFVCHAAVLLAGFLVLFIYFNLFYY